MLHSLSDAPVLVSYSGGSSMSGASDPVLPRRLSRDPGRVTSSAVTPRFRVSVNDLSEGKRCECELSRASRYKAPER